MSRAARRGGEVARLRAVAVTPLVLTEDAAKSKMALAVSEFRRDRAAEEPRYLHDRLKTSKKEDWQVSSGPIIGPRSRRDALAQKLAEGSSFVRSSLLAYTTARYIPRNHGEPEDLRLPAFRASSFFKCFGFRPKRCYRRRSECASHLCHACNSAGAASAALIKCDIRSALALLPAIQSPRNADDTMFAGIRPAF